MSNHTLILNSDYTPLSLLPISTLSWKDSIKMSFLGQVSVIEYYDDWEVHSPSKTFKVPSVVISTTYVKKKYSVKFSRHNLLIRDNFSCQYCNEKLEPASLTIDHVIPRVKGGKTTWENVVSACIKCNGLKGHKNYMKPRIKPFKPDYYRLLDNVKSMPLKIPSEKWIPYLQWDDHLLTIVNPSKNKG